MLLRTSLFLSLTLYHKHTQTQTTQQVRSGRTRGGLIRTTRMAGRTHSKTSTVTSTSYEEKIKSTSLIIECLELVQRFVLDRLHWKRSGHRGWTLFQRSVCLELDATNLYENKTTLTKMSKLRAIKHDMSKQALIDRLCMGYMDLENKRVRVLIQGPFLQIYEAGQDFRSRFPLYVWYSSSLWNILQQTQIRLQGRRLKETCRTILTQRICREIELCGGVSSSPCVSIEDSNRTTLEWCWSGDTYQGHSREVLEEVCT